MIVPDKITPFRKSIIYKLPVIIEILRKGEMKPEELWISVQNHFDDINEYILSLEVAYILGVVELDNKSEVLRYVK